MVKKIILTVIGCAVALVILGSIGYAGYIVYLISQAPF